MAKIEMDISEYEIMKENKKLLEMSLEKERGLQAQVELLTKEKIKALEDAKMKVVKVTKSVVTEHLLRKRDDNKIWMELWHLIGLDYRSLPRLPEYIHTDNLIHAFFEKATLFNQPIEEITTHGLDEIKVEIRNDLKAQMDDETKSKIQRAETALSKNDELLNENKALTKENGLLTEKNKKLTERCDELSDKLTEIEDVSKTLTRIKEILKSGYGLFGKSKILDSLISTVKE